VKLDRRRPCNLPRKAKNKPLAWFYVNEGSIDVLVRSDELQIAMEVNIPRKYLVAALAAMRQR
jgi:hypothetical protein